METIVKLSEFIEDHRLKIFRVIDLDLWDQKGDCAGQGYEGEILSPETVLPGEFEGLFIIKANYFNTDQTSLCAMDITLPERINEFSYFLEGGHVRWVKGRNINQGKVVPSIAIQAYGDSDLFQTDKCRDKVIAALEQGHLITSNKGPVLEDLGHVYRAAGMYENAYNIFTQLLTYKENYLVHVQRAQLLEKLNRLHEAEHVWAQAELLSSHEAVALFRK